MALSLSTYSAPLLWARFSHIQKPLVHFSRTTSNLRVHVDVRVAIRSINGTIDVGLTEIESRLLRILYEK